MWGRGVLLLFPPQSGMHFLAVTKSLRDYSPGQTAPPLWLQLPHWTPGMNAMSSLCSPGPSRDKGFPLLLPFLGAGNLLSPLTLSTLGK